MINKLVHRAHENAVEHGWWESAPTFGEQIALMHSELSEALEDFRNKHGITEIYYSCKLNEPGRCKSDENGVVDCMRCKHAKPCGIPVELADCVIRIFDTCGRYGINLEDIIDLKMNYNETRPYRHGGKVI